MYRKLSLIQIRKLVKPMLDDYVKNQKRNQLIPGMDRIFRASFNSPVGVLWSLLIGISTGLCLFQTYDRIIYYLSRPVAIDVELVDEINKMAQFAPEITVCSQDTHEVKNFNRGVDLFMGLALLNELTYLVPETNLSLMTLWNATDVNKCDKDFNVVLENDTKLEIDGIPRYHPFGLCTTFHLGELMKIENATELELRFKQIGKSHPSRSILGDVRFPTHKWDVRNTWLIAVNTDAELRLGMKIYTFLNTSKVRCLDDKAYEECAKACTIKKLNDSNYTCKFPFFLKDFNVPICSRSEIKKDSFKKAATIFFRLNPTYECGCLKSCKRVVFDPAIFVINAKEGETFLKVNFEKQFVTLIKERYTYDFVSLLCDIGGNMVLFLNLTILSIFDFIYLSWKPKKTPRSNLTRKIVRCLNSNARLQQENVNLADGLKYLTNNSNSRRKRVFWLIVLISCALVSCTQVCFTVMYYLTYPIANIIEIKENKTMHYPDITLCHQNPKFALYYKKYNERFNNSYNICSLQLQQIVDTVYEMLWDEQQNNMKYHTITDTTSVFDFISTAKRIPYKTVLGVCTKLDIEPQVYSGSHSLYVDILKYKLSGSSKKCEWSHPQIFISPKGYRLNPKSRILAALNSRSIVKFEAKKITRLNRPKKPCMKREIAIQCFNKCFDDSLLKSTDCQLPFYNLSLPNCNSSDKASTTYSTYIKEIMQNNPFQKCKCHKECDEELFSAEIFNEPNENLAVATIFIFVYQHNLIENIVETYTFTIEKLFSDIGSWLGLFLGVSITSMFDFMHVICETASKCSTK